MTQNNRTIRLSREDREKYLIRTDYVHDESAVYLNDFFSFNDQLPSASVDLIIIDPPYNLTKTYSGTVFHKMRNDEYCGYMNNIIEKCLRVLKPTGTMYICGDWETSFLQLKCIREFEENGQCICINRITWARDKGRAKAGNWKNNIEDILMVVKSDSYVFNSDAIMVRKKVLAPYRDKNGNNKDWVETEDGKYRLTWPSNIWNDITVPFWSMPENTDHPTQKPEKLYAKLILASSNLDDVVYEPFAGTGTACVTAKKLGRQFIGVEKEEEYYLLACKRLELAETDKSIQGYENNTFTEKK
jgi:site-specific DNA-methyltransferase (adenine-specific)